MPPNAPTLFTFRKEGRGSTVSFESLIIVLVDILLPENQQVAYNFKFYHILVVCLLSAGSTVVVTHFNIVGASESHYVSHFFVSAHYWCASRVQLALYFLDTLPQPLLLLVYSEAICICVCPFQWE